MPLLAFGVSLTTSLLLVPLVRRLSFRLGKVAQPRQDRWHKKPTPVLGGVGMFLAFLGGLFFAQGGLEIPWGLLAGAAIMFAVGLYDDLRPLTPPAKMVGQISAAAVVVFSGYTTGFFSAALLNILITVVWLVGITNAINLLDNMDGLAGGISFIAASIISFFFWQTPGEGLLVFSLSLAGAILGFLVFNFPPASIFMGDSGSLFLGFTLAALAIARKPQASNVFAVMSVPTLIFLLPILDTALVTFTRLLRGQSPVQGGRDHTSHRLVAFGLSERQAVLVLYAIALASGVVGAVLESLDYSLGLVLIPVIVLSFALLAAYLGRLKIIETSHTQEFTAPKPLTTIMLELTYKRRVLEIVLDFFVISIAYYLAFWVRFGFSLNAANTELLLRSLPVVVGSAYLSFFVLGVYRGVWRYLGITDLVRFGIAALSSAALSGVVQGVYLPQALSLGTLFLFTIFLLLGLAASRSSFRLFDQIFGGATHTRGEEARVLLVGAGDVGEMALRWIRQNPGLGYHPIGIVDPDPFKWGRRIHGVEVLGSPEQLESILAEKAVEGVILSAAFSGNDEIAEKTLAVCHEQGVWVRRMRFEFELVS